MEQEPPPLTGHPVLDAWRLRHRAQLAGELPPSVPEQRQPTRSESLLWQALRRERAGWEREYATGPYRLDFFCPTARLAVEVDGGSHAGRTAWSRDVERDAWHREHGITTKRFSASEVERDLPGVLREIRRHVRAELGLEEEHPVVPATAPDPAPTPAAPAAVRSSSRPGRPRRRRRGRSALGRLIPLAVLSGLFVQAQLEHQTLTDGYVGLVEWLGRRLAEALVPAALPTGAVVPPIWTAATAGS